MATVAMVTKVQKMLNSNRTADPFETWHKNRSFSNRFRFFLAYLVQLDVDVIPNKFDQFLFGE
jgi:hypothetical protein